MVKKIFVISFMMLCLSMNVFAQENVELPVINTQATASDEVAPDTAKIKFFVTNSGLNVENIKEKNDEIVNDAITKIKAQLNEKEQIKTIAYSVRNIYSYKDKIRIFQKYEVKNGFEVKLKDLSKISQIIKIATDSGIKEVGQLNFSIENTQQVCNTLLAKSAKMAKERANVVATSIGEQLGKAKQINPTCSLDLQQSYRRNYGASFATNKIQAESADSTTVVEVIEPGSINVNASVNIIYYLK